MSEQSKQKKWKLTRRGFLIGFGATGLALALGVKLGTPVMRLKVAEYLDTASFDSGIDAPPTLWFEIDDTNQVHLYLPKIEMGQGVHTALAQIAAEDLEIAWEQLQVHQATTAHGPQDPGATGGSTSVSALYLPLREAAATLHFMLRQEASRQLNISSVDLIAENGAFYSQNDPTVQVTYARLIGNLKETDIPETTPPLKPASEFQYIGQPISRVDLPDKITGKAIYGYDMRVPDMLYGAVARPPKLGSQLIRSSAGQATNSPGVVKVVTQPDFAGVVAESRAQAYAALNALDLEWSDITPLQQADIEAMTTVGNGNGTVIQQEGDVSDHLTGDNVITATYRTPMAAHAHLEAQAALADVQPDKVQVWASTQSPVMLRDEIASMLGRNAEDVEVIATYLGGGFGRKLNIEVAFEAVRLSQAVGRPVHVGWNRTEDLRYGYFRPPTHHVLKAKLNQQGDLLAMEHQQASGDVAFPFLPGFLKVVMGADFGAWRGGLIQYNIPNRQTIAWRTKLPIPTGWWRGLGLLANTFAIESFIDEIAHNTGADPLTFRLQNFPDTERGRRFKAVLQAAADQAGWGKTLLPGQGRGLACSVDVNTVVAHIAEVSIEAGEIRVNKVTAAMDPGLVINPDGATAQTEGAIIMGLSSTLFEAITIKDGNVEATNFDRYPLITIKDAPEIDVVLLESGDKPLGVGEPPLGPIAAAVANAIFDLTGQRLRNLPLTLENV